MLTTNQGTYPQPREKHPYTVLQLLNLLQCTRSITTLQNVLYKSDQQDILKNNECRE